MNSFNKIALPTELLPEKGNCATESNEAQKSKEVSYTWPHKKNNKREIKKSQSGNGATKFPKLLEVSCAWPDN